MAVFSARAIRAGEEVTHTYIPHDVLLAPEPVRAAHLHFKCECARCVMERADPRVAAGKLLGKRLGMVMRERIELFVD